MCEVAKETVEHLLNTGSVVEQMWSNLHILFQQTNRNNNSLRQTIEKWKKGGYQSPVVNKAWIMIIGFLL